MDKNILEGKWKQIKGEAQKTRGKLTDDDLDQIDGDREVFLGRLQEKYGVAREEAEDMLNKFERDIAS